MKKLPILLPLILAGCQYPIATVSTVDAPPLLRVLGASPNAIVAVDGQSAGSAAAFGAGGKALAITHGTHLVEIRDGGSILFSSPVYFGEGVTKTIALSPGPQ